MVSLLVRNTPLRPACSPVNEGKASGEAQMAQSSIEGTPIAARGPGGLGHEAALRPPFREGGAPTSMIVGHGQQYGPLTFRE